MLSKKETELLDALEPRAASEGVEIVTVQVVGAKKAPTIRVFIDTPEGVSFDELAKAQAWINDIMDALDPFPEPTPWRCPRRASTARCARSSISRVTPVSRPS